MEDNEEKVGRIINNLKRIWNSIKRISTTISKKMFDVGKTIPLIVIVSALSIILSPIIFLIITASIIMKMTSAQKGEAHA